MGRSSLCMVVTSPSLNMEENLNKGTRRTESKHQPTVFEKSSSRKKAEPPGTSCYLQGLRRADGLHVFLPFVINCRLYETVEDNSLYTPGAQKRKRIRGMNGTYCERCAGQHLQVKTHSYSIGSNQYLAGVIRVIKLLGLRQLGACSSHSNSKICLHFHAEAEILYG